VWFEELISPEEVAFESGVFLTKKEKAKSLKGLGINEVIQPEPEPMPGTEAVRPDKTKPKSPTISETCILRLTGNIPPELWNRLGTKILPKLRSGTELQVGINFQVSLKADQAGSLKSDLSQILEDLGLSGKVHIEES